MEWVESRTCWDLDIVVLPESLLLRRLGSEPWVSYRGYLRRRLLGDTERAAERRSLYLVLLLDSVDFKRFSGDTERHGLWLALLLESGDLRRFPGDTERAVERRCLWRALLLGSGEWKRTVLLPEGGESSLCLRRVDLAVA